MSKIDRLKEIMVLLRDPVKGCPWDVEQDFKSIAPHTIEEAYEVVSAIDKGDMLELKEELGDLLLQVIFHSQIADEEGIFCFEDVVESINNKLVDRHPHVFGDMDIKTAKEQEISWEKIKEQERQKKAGDENISALDGVAVALPALTRANKLQKRASKVGFDWPNIDGVFDKIEEELAELKEEIKIGGNIKEEYGDVLFSVSNLAVKLKLSPEDCLRESNAKFEHRFHHIEKRLREKECNIEDASLEEMSAFWQEAKGI